jgi:hypothetical protein
VETPTDTVAPPVPEVCESCNHGAVLEAVQDADGSALPIVIVVVWGFMPVAPETLRSAGETVTASCGAAAKIKAAGSNSTAFM